MMVSRNRDLAKFWIVMDTYVRPSEKIDQGGFCPGLFLNAVASELVLLFLSKCRLCVKKQYADRRAVGQFLTHSHPQTLSRREQP